LDIHLTADEASLEERAAIDQVLGEPQSGWEGGERRIDFDGRVSVGGHHFRSQRHLLLPSLHAIQKRIGWISPGAINYVAQRLDVAPAEIHGVASFYHMFSLAPRAPVVAYVCEDIACLARGAEQICEELEKKLSLPSGTTWRRGPCLGLCERAPAALITAAGEHPWDHVLAPATAEALVSVMHDAAAGRVPPESDTLRTGISVPQAGQPQLRLLRRVGQADPTDIHDYRRRGGYDALRLALQLGSERVISELIESRLLGRGGAAFPTGKKSEAVRLQSDRGRPHYLICNADESEPGTFKDRIVMEGDPFAVLEGMSIVAFAAGVRKGYIYIRGEYPLATQRLQHAIQTARAYGMLGDRIFGADFQFDVELRRGAGAYICGEETALFNSIEGYRGEPRNKPPFPTQSGLFHEPTQVNNVETLINVPEILLGGGSAYARIGTANSTGHRLFCLSGHVTRPGVYEVPFGATLRQMIELAGGVGGTGRLQAVLLGGAAGAFVSPRELDTPLTFEGTRAIGASLGSGVIMLFDDSVDLKRILLRIASFFREETCGQCVPCRVGTIRQEEALHRLIHEAPLVSIGEEIGLLREMGQAMRDASICGLGQTASSALESALQRWSLFS
jgi:NADH-quinone oxidoreductase subunit F